MTQETKTPAWILRITYESGAVEERPVGAGLRVGRAAPHASAGPDISVNDPRVSREHLQFGVDESGLFVVCSGKNGVDLNGTNVTGRHALNPGDVLRLFDLVLGVSLRAEIKSSAKKTNPATAPDSRKLRKVLIAALVAVVAAGSIAVFVKSKNSGTAKPVNAKANRSSPSQMTPKSPKQSRAAAIEEAKLARKLFDERNILPENRFACIKHYKNALSGIKPEPEDAGLCSLWRADSAIAARELDSLFNDFRKKSLIAYKQNKEDLSSEYLENVMQLYPDPDDPHYQWAKKNLVVLGKAGLMKADN